MLQPLRPVEDPAVPALGILLSADALELLHTLVARVGGSVESARVRQVRYVPGSSVTVQYQVGIRVESSTSSTMLVATSGLTVPEPAVRLAANGVEIAAWAYPNDPFLPGLRSAADPHMTRALLEDLGAAPSEVRLRRRAYRAGRRAVIEVEGGAASVYLKVVRPARVGALQSIHADFAGHLPVPQSLGWSEELGIVALQALSGRPLRKAIQSGSSSLPSAEALVELLDKIPPSDRTASAGPVSRIGSHARLLRATMPELSDRLDGLVERVAAAPAEELQPAHGDFHAGQILIEAGRINGLVDVDTAGMGARSDDYAGILAQLSTLAIGSPQRALVERYGASLIAGFDRLVDPVGLRLRIAAAVVGFATGPFRVQMAEWPEATLARVALAERWVSSAEQR